MDSPVKTGSKTSGKQKAGRAAALACAALILAWLGAHPKMVDHALARIRQRIFPVRTDQWIDMPGAGNVCGTAGDTFFTFDGGTLLACDMNGSIQWELETELHDPVIETRDGYALAYEPGGRYLYLADEGGCSILDVPAGADAAAPGPEGGVAVITAGSGYLSELKVFDRDGTIRFEAGFPDQVIADLTYLKNGTLALCGVSRSGNWSLILGDRTVPLETEAVCDMAPAGNGVALWTVEGLLRFDETGELTASMPGQGLDWACGGALALLVYQDGGFRLQLFARDGTVSRSDILPRMPGRLTVCKDFVCVLDRESLLIYDDRGARREMRSSGGAARILSWRDGLILVGEDRIFIHWNP